MIHLAHVAIWLLQGDDANAAPASPPSTGISALLDMLHHIGPVALVVLAVLGLSSLYSWGIILAKSSQFRRARKQSRRFLRSFRKASRLQEIATVSDQFRPSPLVKIFDDVYEMYRRQTGGFGPPRNIAALERAAQIASGDSLAVLESRLTWLASIAQVSPFVGLFGTVMGIIGAFQGLGMEGATTLRAVAPGVSEALITTAAGLLVAIPSVIAYNQLTSSLREFGASMDDFSREMVNSLEDIAQGQGADPTEREAARGLHK
jgi:biopolymer transport protein TolQ